MNEEQTRRAAENQAVFRAVNEQIERLNRGLAELSGRPLRVVCECGDLGCIEQMEVTVARYEQVRADPHLFLVKSGHELPDAECALERDDGICVVRKHPGTGQQVARACDLRG